MTSKVFVRLFGLFVVLLVLYTLVIELAFHGFVEHSSGATLRVLGGEAFWAGLIAPGVALPLGRVRFPPHLISLPQCCHLRPPHRRRRFDRAHRCHTCRERAIYRNRRSLLDGSCTQRNRRAAGRDFAELASGRDELAVMLDSMQEAVVAITSAGSVRWSNAVMQRIAGSQLVPGRPLVHFVRDPELLACVRGALERRELCVGRASLLAPGQVFEVNAAPLPAGGALIVLHDVTSIETAQKSRREFVANVSHELRTPLTSIQGYVETLIEDPNPSS